MVYGDVTDDQCAAITASGVVVLDPRPDHELAPPGLARFLVDQARAAPGPVLWVGSADGDPGLTDALAAEVSRPTDPPTPVDIEVLVGSYDPPGARLLDLVAVMDRLREECPWDRQQTHESLLAYLVEETYEVVEAVTVGGRRQLVDELGDLLLQVAFHARIAEEATQPGAGGFDIDDVAGAIVDKLVRRHPHVFADVEVDGSAGVEASWEAIKAAERAGEPSRPTRPAGLTSALTDLVVEAVRQVAAGHDPTDDIEATREGWRAGVSLAGESGQSPLG